ncbi:MAG: D-alanyl-lipoteichoic acid acyltransferase DltB (MBOAT superfamily) [Vicingaceae bacterium]|jgi:D-alanyl-lipoteichoic acid acyltransferase DltB (MBOAT superfamily)
MLFNSLDFALFLPIVFILYWFIANKSLTIQNALIVLASYVFYGWWDWRFLFLIFFSSIVDFNIGLLLKKENTLWKRKLFLWISIIVNLGLLSVFKYYNFFVDNFIAAFSLFGFKMSAQSLNIILPVGISFYSFQTLSYTIDVYKKKLQATGDIISFLAFVSFFPQLVAGPIERATQLLPQFYKKRKFEYDKAVDGMRQILWGLFKKIVIADNCAIFANQVFDNSTDYGGSTLILGALFFAFQIYGDFSGYSDIAIGTSRLFGFDLMRNFAFPYFSRDIAEFWRRWHISLSTWFRDYLYIPLGGSRGGAYKKIRNIFIIFLVSGFWHGANWTFVTWGALNALFFLPLLLSKNNRNHLDIVAKDKTLPTLREFSQIVLTFGLVVFAWIFFRAENISHALSIVKEIFTLSSISVPQILTPKIKMAYTLLLLGLFIIVEWKNREEQFGLAIHKLNKPLRWFFYTSVLLLIITFGNFGKNEFIYFQF